MYSDHIVMDVARMKVEGKNQNEITSELRKVRGCEGISQATVSRMLKTETARKTIEHQTARYLDTLNDITDLNIKVINTCKQLVDAIAEDKPQVPLAFKDKDGNINIMAILKYLEVNNKFSTDLQKGMGILPSASQSVLIQQIYNDNRSVNLSPDIMAALGDKLAAIGASGSDDEIIEVEGG